MRRARCWTNKRSRWRRCLAELDVHGKPVIEVLNKIDLSEPEDSERTLATGTGRTSQGRGFRLDEDGAGRPCLRPSMPRWWSDPLVEARVPPAAVGRSRAGRARGRRAGRSERLLRETWCTCPREDPPRCWNAIVGFARVTDRRVLQPTRIFRIHQVKQNRPPVGERRWCPQTTRPVRPRT